ncbi:DNA-binding response regulator [Thermogemmatispora aurantia]|uniref:DNA-binding response regulator n=1 Tax=Thermogemmatispora aurantia TaxID=2045279 RepID=A0A5J4KAE8_9CHLR|nr:response regulator transcription factor [Thermogemmatispora aurantia]GER83719.1 DNA-binding response regulator [Thermogemmatispora aurantia]
MVVGTGKARRILLAEDELALRDFVSRNLRVRGFEVLEASTGLEALALFERERPHLLILDLMMPRMDGLEVCRRVREQSTVPIIVLTALDAERDKVAALDLGADDYLTKPFGVEELLARVRAVLRRTQWESGTPAPLALGARRFGEIEVDLDRRTVRRSGEEVRLSPTEFALLEQLVTQAGKVLTHRWLLQRVWGPEYGGEVEYLRVYLNRLRQKLEPDPAHPRYLLTEPGVGYRFVAPGPKVE